MNARNVVPCVIIGNRSDEKDITLSKGVWLYGYQMNGKNLQNVCAIYMMNLRNFCFMKQERLLPEACKVST